MSQSNDQSHSNFRNRKFQRYGYNFKSSDIALHFGYYERGLQYTPRGDPLETKKSESLITPKKLKGGII